MPAQRARGRYAPHKERGRAAFFVRPLATAIRRLQKLPGNGFLSEAKKREEKYQVMNDTEKNGKPRQEEFPVFTLMREDITDCGFDGGSVDDATMGRIAGKLCDYFLTDGYWRELVAELCGMYGVEEVAPRED